MLLRDLYPVRRSVKMIESLCQRCGDKQAQAGKVEGDRNTQTVRQRKQEEEENQTIVAFSDVVGIRVDYTYWATFSQWSSCWQKEQNETRTEVGGAGRYVGEGRLKCKENYSELSKDLEKKVFLLRLGQGCQKAEEIRRANGGGEQRKAVVSRRKTEKRREGKKGENRRRQERKGRIDRYSISTYTRVPVLFSSFCL